MSETVAVALVSGAAGLFGASIGGGATYAAQRRARKDQRQDDLVNTLSRFLHALELLDLELRALPARPTRSERLTTAMTRRLPTLGAALMLLARMTTARGLHRASPGHQRHSAASC
jgi:hypothetical protein